MKNKKIRIWWNPQIPMKPFFIPVDNIQEAKLLLDALSIYDEWQFENKIKPDFSNAGGIQIWDEDSDGEGNPDWIDWYDEENGEDDFDEYCEKNNIKLGLIDELNKINDINWRLK